MFLFLTSLFGWKDEKKRIFKLRAGVRIRIENGWLLKQLGKIANRAGFSLPPETLLLVLVFGHVFGVGIGLIYGQSDIATAGLAFVIPGITLAYFAFKIRRRQNLLNAQVEAFLESTSNALYGNPAILSAIQAAYQAADQPMKGELERVLNEIEHGIEISRALTSLTRRIDSEVLSLAISGIIVCRDTGGNMSKMLESLVEIARIRSNLHGKIRAMTSQQRTTAILVTAIPLLFIVCAQGLNPAYKDYFMTPLGGIVIAYTIISVVVGFLWLNKMTSTLLEPGKC